jgi:ParB family chromosome partitioning protein
MAKHGLGKGLDAILGSSQPAYKSSKSSSDIISEKKEAEQKQIQTEEKKEEVKGMVAMLPLEKILPNPSQPRHNFDQNTLAELLASIKEHGIIQPLIVRKLSSGNYELIAGERRWRAAKEAGFKDVPAIVREVSQEQIVELSLVENLQRQDLNPIEEAEGYEVLASHFGLTQEKIAEKVDRKSVV